MSDQLGFTFYPKDWWTSDKFFNLEPIERYIYLECLFIMYQNDGYLKTQKTQIEKRLSLKITDDQWENITEGFVIENNLFTHKSVNKRLKKAITNRINGSKGGRPPKENKPKKPNLETQNNPPSEREKEREKEREDEGMQSSNYDAVFFTISDFEKLDLEDGTFMMIACRDSKKSIDEVKGFKAEFVKYQKAMGAKAWKSEKDAKLHYVNWLKKQQKTIVGQSNFNF